ncbi:MAG: aconitate hydratase [Desulfofustis sp.]|jgi:aconitate hydratase|nr:aconitate hydratase [Desulfofustis sp.]
MLNLDSTPEFVAGVYQTIRKNLQVVRRRLGRPLTLADKILLGHLDNPEEQEMIPGSSYLHVRPDRVILQDVLGQSAMLQFMMTGRKRVAVPTTVHCDHLIEARVAGDLDLPASIAENNEVYDFLKSAAAKFGAGFWEPGAGIIHQVNLENYAFPGAVILGTDSHTPNAGGIGACAVGVGGADAIDAMAGLPWEVLAPKHIGVVLTGELSGWAAPKDIILYVAGELTVSGGTNSIIEYFGPGARTLSCTGKATIANMGAELGATTSIFEFDDHIAKYLRATGRGELADLAARNADLLEVDEAVSKNPHDYFDRVVEIDLSALEPYVVGPHSPDRARPLSKLAAEIAGSGGELLDDISTCLIGSCTNSSYEDMSRAADVADQARSRGIKAAVPLMVTPGSEQIRATIERDGQMASLKEIGGTVLANACGPCIGQWKRDVAIASKPNTIVTSYNRNFPRRNDGQPTTMNFIASPEITVALSLAGKLSFNPMTDSLTDGDGRPFKLKPPNQAPDVPEKGFDKGESRYHAPPDDGSDIELKVDPNSQRLQLLKPWPKWDGRDIENAPVLLKAKGKCTTDAISPAGPWLRLRGHLDKFSDNMFMGAINAYTGEAGKGLNLITGKTDQPFSEIARDYKARQVQWVVIGDWNYGEGSSREHAALSPRLLGGAAVIVRSFARIHESNLKKQGMLAFTFDNPDDYDKIREDDHISIPDLASLAPGKQVDCVVSHADGTSDRLKLNHTYNAAQVEWFKAGSALNLMA